MSRHKQKPPRRYRQLSDDLPSMNPMRVDRGSKAGFTNEESIEQLKDWADHNQR